MCTLLGSEEIRHKIEKGRVSVAMYYGSSRGRSSELLQEHDIGTYMVSKIRAK